jgi:O-antigen/teichoic acid export membrane protein
MTKAPEIGQFTKYVISTIVTQFIVLFISIASFILVARLLGPEGRGGLALIMIIPALAITIGRMGIGHAVNYYASKIPAPNLIINSIALTSFLSLIIIAVTTPVVYLFKDFFFKGIDGNILIIISLLTPIFLFHNFLISLMQGLYKIFLRNLLNIIQAIVTFSGLIFLVYFVQAGLNGAVTVYITSTLVVVIIPLLYFLSTYSFKSAKLEYDIIRKILKFGTKSHIGNVLKDLSYRADILIISYFLTPSSVGLYVVAVTMAEVIWKLPDAIGSVLLPRIAGMSSAEAKDFTPRACRIIILPLCVVCFTILLFSDKLILLVLGPQYAQSINVLMLLTPGIMMLSIWKILANDLIGQGYPGLYSVTSGLALVTMISLDFLLIPIYGINGAAIASTLSYAITTVSIVVIYLWISKNTFASIIIPTKSDINLYVNIINSYLLKR